MKQCATSEIYERAIYEAIWIFSKKRYPKKLAKRKPQ